MDSSYKEKAILYNYNALQERELRGITQNMLKNEKVLEYVIWKIICLTNLIISIRHKNKIKWRKTINMKWSGKVRVY